VRVAATVDDADAAEELSLHLLLDADGIPGEDRLIRRVARTGFADWGVELTIETLWPEPTLTADGAWWHPVGIADPLMQVASTPLPLITVVAVMRDPQRPRTRPGRGLERLPLHLTPHPIAHHPPASS
jgi:hypothetical protein